MKFTETCEHCGHTTAAYTHKINTSMARALEQLCEFYENHKRRANLAKDLKLTKAQYNNFQKLQYWNLVHRDRFGWIPTEKAFAFLKGNTVIPNFVATINGKVLDISHPAWETHTKNRHSLHVSEILNTLYKSKEEYQEERGTKNPTLFT